MAKVEGGRLVAKTLSELGVKDIFTLGGGHINPIYNSCPEFGIRLVDTHQEQGASMAADAYGRVSRRPGVCLVTAGPGFTNTLTGIAGAHLSNSPLLLLAGRSGIEENDRLSLQEIDQEAMARPVTKWARTVYDPSRIPQYITEAYKQAIAGRPGPVYLGMSYEVLYPSVYEQDIKNYDTRIPNTRVAAPNESTDELISMLADSKKPVAIAGSGAWYSKSEDSLKKFIELTGIPLYTLNFGRGIVSDLNPLCFGAASPGAPNGFRKATSEADLILLLGVRLSIYIGFGNTFNPRAKVAQIDIDPAEIGRNRAVDLPITGDLSSSLKQVSKLLKANKLEMDYKDWVEHIRSVARAESGDLKAIKSSEQTPIHILRVVKAVENVLGGECTLVIDGGDTQAFTDGNYTVTNPGHYVKGGPLGCMGVGVPFAIGAKLARPDTPLVLISGDGAMGMNFMEFNTALRHGIPFVAVVCNDGAWGMTKHQLDITYGQDVPKPGVMLGHTPFHKVIESLGGYGELVEDPRELEGAIERALDSGLASVINIHTDPDTVSGATKVITEMMMSVVDK